MNSILAECKLVGSSAYFGERGNWLIAYAVHRDSDTLTRSNFDCFRAALSALPAVKDWSGADSPVTVERFSHWAVGWVDYLVIDPACAEAVVLAEELRSQLDDYPALNEDHFSTAEQAEAEQVWRDCYRSSERIAYMRQYRSQFSPRSFADLLNCARGKYFLGYASELLA